MIDTENARMKNVRAFLLYKHFEFFVKVSMLY